jgi:hypothetical protein
MYTKLADFVKSVTLKASKWFQGILNRWALANYHEFPVTDSDGNVIGHEFYTTRAIDVTFVADADRNDREEASCQDP